MGSVGDYQHLFESLSTKVTGLSEQWLISFFIAGLQDYLKCQLRLAKPTTYPEAVALARLHEQNFLALQQSLKSTPSLPTIPAPRPRFNVKPLITPPTKP